MARDTLAEPLERLLRATAPDAGDVAAALEAHKALAAAAAGAGQEALNTALDRLAAQLLVPDVEHAALLAMACADLVACGGSAGLAVDSMLTKLIGILQQAQDFVAECRRRAAAAGQKPDDARNISDMAQAVADDQPALGWAWRGLPYYCDAAAAVLGRTVEAPDIVRSHAELRAECRALAGINDQQTLGPLRNLLAVLEVNSDFALALRVITDADAPGSLALAAMAAIEFDADKLDAGVRDEALRELAWALRFPGYRFPVVLARAIEVLVRHGGDATIGVNAFLDRLSATAALAAEFVRAGRAEWERQRRPAAPDDAAMLDALDAPLRDKMPDHALAWSGLGPMASSLLALLTSAPEARSKARSHPELLTAIDNLDPVRDDEGLAAVRLLGRAIRALDSTQSNAQAQERVRALLAERPAMSK